MFYKILEKGIEKAPNFLLINGKQVFTNSEKLHNENGYYRLKINDLIELLMLEKLILV